MNKQEVAALARAIAEMMATKTVDQNALFLSRILPKMDETSLEYLAIAWNFAHDLGTMFNNEDAPLNRAVVDVMPLVLAELPETYPPAQFMRDTDAQGAITYSLTIDHTIIFQGVAAAEALIRANRYVGARKEKGGATLPVGVIDGIYD